MNRGGYTLVTVPDSNRNVAAMPLPEKYKPYKRFSDFIGTDVITKRMNPINLLSWDIQIYHGIQMDRD